MKLYTPEKTLLMEVSALKEVPEGIMIEGTIMGALPMKAVLRPEELRAARKLVDWRLIRRALGMMMRGRTPAAPDGAKR